MRAKVVVYLNPYISNYVFEVIDMFARIRTYALHLPVTPLLIAIVALTTTHTALAKQQQVRTVFWGHVFYFEDDEGRPYPWPKEITESSLSGVLRHLQSDAERYDVPRPHIFDHLPSDKLGDIAKYKISLSPESVLHTFILEFRYGVYFGRAEQALWDHLGERILNINVFKKHNNDTAAYNSVLKTLDNPRARSKEIDSALATIFSLNKKGTKKYYFSDAVLLLKQVAENSLTLTRRSIHIAMYIDFEIGFDRLPVEDQVRILFELGHVFSNTENIDQYVGPDFTFFHLAQHFYRKAAILALNHPRELSENLLASLFQGKYKLECEAELFGECVNTIRSFFLLTNDFNQATYVGFYSDAATAVEEISKYGVGVDANIDDFIERVVGDAVLLNYWIGLHCMVNSNSRAKQRLANKPYTKEIAKRAQLIFNKRAGAICDSAEPNV